MSSQLVSPFVDVAMIAKNLCYVPLLPLIGSLTVYLLTSQRKEMHKMSGWIATLFSFGSFLIVCRLFAELAQTNITSVLSPKHLWFTVGSLSVDFALRMDNLSAVMCLIITGVGSLIHLYAIGYMAHDENRPRFFSYLNLFLFAMLVLVLGDNLLLMFVGWEGVGLCSYLLIGFWFKEMGNAVAGQKAFVVNRIGDAGFLIGIFLLVYYLGTLSFSQLAGTQLGLSPRIVEIIAFCLFIGAVGKSAQIPLYVWLPDAMAGPTPVSALIHAATMVTAGVYMITRMSFLYLHAPITLSIILVVGTLTAFFAATIALTQTDIKKVLAYSTVSQLGYMFMALGAGAFSNGIYHVVTHAFFKACLFMAAGSVIIGCHHEQDMRNFGGLWKKMPLTFFSYFVATLAIAGFPFLSGFYSKDAILWTVFSARTDIHIYSYGLNKLCWGVGLFTAFLTAFYMTRSLVLTFFGKYRGHAHPHESPVVVTLPLIILAGFSFGFAMLCGNDLLNFLDLWTRRDMLEAARETLEHNHLYHTLEMTSIAVAISGIVFSALLYLVMPKLLSLITRALSSLHTASLNKWWVDELYAAIVINPLRVFSQFLFSFVDRFLIDGTVNGLGYTCNVLSAGSRRIHIGKIGTYALYMFFGVVFITVFWVVLGA